MLSRVADNLFWMSRYLERAEHVARLLDVHTNLALEMGPDDGDQSRDQRLVSSLTASSEAMDDIREDELVRQLTFDMDNPLAILFTITNARENARFVREQISSEMWTQINTLYLDLKEAKRQSRRRASPHDLYMDVQEGAHLFQGITDATMNHNQGWQFIQLGRHIERTLNLLQLLDVHFSDTELMRDDNATTQVYFELTAMLKSVSAFEAYCKVYNPNLEVWRIVEFLIFNAEFPRSLRFGVNRIVDSLDALADATSRSKNTRMYRNAGRLQSQLSYDEMGDVRNLHEYLETSKRQIHQIHAMLYETFITYPIETVF
jgi:uncharacterized alpha-E superfamily protein